jgi:DnaK suppressor protein
MDPEGHRFTRYGLCHSTGGIVKTMEKIQIQQYRWKLESRREDAVRLLGQLASETRALDVDSPQDSGAQSIGSIAKESLIQQTSQRRHLVRMIEAALRRIADGTYGICVACADDIPRKRLEALPWTDCCLRCQEIAERELESEPSPQAPGRDIPWKRAG